MKNIKKFYPLIVGLVLLISVAAYGTRAYFSDSTSEEANIKLTLGRIDIESNPTVWGYKPETKENTQLKNAEGKKITTNNLTEKLEVENVRPGDAFIKEFTFTNNSNLDAKVSIKQNITAAQNGIFDVSLISKEVKGGVFSENKELVNKDVPQEFNGENIVLKGNEEATVTLKVSVRTDLTDEQEKNFNLTDKKVVLDLLEKNMEVELVQDNAKQK